MDFRAKLSFVSVVGALVVLYFASGSPISLYSMWQDELGLTHAQLSMASMWYLLGTVFPLMFLPRISNHLGRRPATVMIMMVSLCGAITFMMVNSPEMIMAGRLIQGIASGLGSSTVAAYVVDLSTDLPRWVGPMITSSAPTLGLSTGAFASGGIITFTDIGATSYFEAVVVLLVVITVMVVFARETMPRSPGLLRSLIPKFTLPENSLRLYAACSMIFVGTWALGGFSQSFSAVIVSEHLGMENAFVSAVVFTSLLLPNALGSFFAKRFETRQAQRWGMGAFAVFTTLMYVSLAYIDSILLFCLFSIAAGISQGIAFTAGVTELMGRATQAQRAGTFSLIYLTSYGGAAIPNLVVGLFSGDMSVESIMFAYIVLIIVMFAILLVLSAKPYPERKAPEVMRS
ncbi:MAG: MFS transporter [Thermoplasmata archaeon]|nr:MFS transporter [Thermoplasmata archaeon]